MRGAGGIKRAAEYSGGEFSLRLTLGADAAGLRLDQALARQLTEFSRSQVQAWIECGRVRVAGSAVKAKQRVFGGELVEIAVPDEARAGDHAAQPISFPLVHTEAAFLVLDKPAGLVVHPGNGNSSGTLLNALLHFDPALAALPRAGIVHRLDKDTSGLMVIARRADAASNLIRQLQARSVSRYYWAVVAGAPRPSGEVDLAIGRDPRRRTRMAVQAQGRPALTRFHVVERFAGASLIEARLATGRTHQIRVHMAALGHPLLGDPVYGAKRRSVATFRRQALHAFHLEFDHPDSGDRVAFTAPAPDDFASLLVELRRTARG